MQQWIFAVVILLTLSSTINIRCTEPSAVSWYVASKYQTMQTFIQEYRHLQGKRSSIATKRLSTNKTPEITNNPRLLPPRREKIAFKEPARKRKKESFIQPAQPILSHKHSLRRS